MKSFAFSLAPRSIVLFFWGFVAGMLISWTVGYLSLKPIHLKVSRKSAFTL